jgi:hypothetical protein
MTGRPESPSAKVLTAAVWPVDAELGTGGDGAVVGEGRAVACPLQGKPEGAVDGAVLSVLLVPMPAAAVTLLVMVPLLVAVAVLLLFASVAVAFGKVPAYALLESPVAVAVLLLPAPA